MITKVSQIKDVRLMCWHLLKKNQCESQKLSPIKAALLQALLHTHYQVMIWKNYIVPKTWSTTFRLWLATGLWHVHSHIITATNSRWCNTIDQVWMQEDQLFICMFMKAKQLCTELCSCGLDEDTCIKYTSWKVAWSGWWCIIWRRWIIIIHCIILMMIFLCFHFSSVPKMGKCYKFGTFEM